MEKDVNLRKVRKDQKDIDLMQLVRHQGPCHIFFAVVCSNMERLVKVYIAALLPNFT